jgi:hypothetical protein
MPIGDSIIFNPDRFVQSLKVTKHDHPANAPYSIGWITTKRILIPDFNDPGVSDDDEEPEHYMEIPCSKTSPMFAVMLETSDVQRIIDMVVLLHGTKTCAMCQNEYIGSQNPEIRVCDGCVAKAPFHVPTEECIICKSDVVGVCIFCPMPNCNKTSCWECIKQMAFSRPNQEGDLKCPGCQQEVVKYMEKKNRRIVIPGYNI